MKGNIVTTIWGSIFTFALALPTLIQAEPELFDFISEPWLKGIKLFCAIVALLSGGSFAYNTKSKNVTGGTIPATHEAESRVKE